VETDNIGYCSNKYDSQPISAPLPLTTVRYRTSEPDCDERVDEVFEELIADQDDSKFILVLNFGMMLSRDLTQGLPLTGRTHYHRASAAVMTVSDLVKTEIFVQLNFHVDLYVWDKI